MKTLGVFNHVTVDGCFAGPNGEIDWFKSIGKDDEFEAYTHQQSSGGSALLFGRTTYEMMKSFWPTEEGRKADPHMAEVMNESPKYVVSKSLKDPGEGPHWRNVTILRELNRDKILELKRQSDITILGSGTIVQQLANLGLIDSYQLVVVPLVLGNGKRLFEGVEQTDLKLADSRAFKNGLVVMQYEPR